LVDTDIAAWGNRMGKERSPCSSRISDPPDRADARGLSSGLADDGGNEFELRETRKEIARGFAVFV
jgi:hypothetical protein